MMQGVLNLRAALKASAASSKWKEIVSHLTDKEHADLVDWPAWARPDQVPDDIWRRRWQ